MSGGGEGDKGILERVLRHRKGLKRRRFWFISVLQLFKCVKFIVVIEEFYKIDM